MLKIFMVFLGGGIGAAIRYKTSEYFNLIAGFFPFGTLFVNVLGSFIIGFVAALFLSHTNFSPNVKLLLTTGFCGGLTTFSTFAFESWNLFLDGEILKGIIYIILNVILSIAAVILGVLLAKQLG